MLESRNVLYNGRLNHSALELVTFPEARCWGNFSDFYTLGRVCRMVEYFSSAKDWRALKLSIAESTFE